jgi:hypothetical protein
MTWTVKVTHRLTLDKEITKEIKIDPKAFIFKLALKAAEIFNIENPQHYSIM